MSEEKELREMTEQELKSAIAEVTIKIGESEAAKKRDAALHKEVIDEYKAEQTMYIDELLLRREG
jgi:hypothetical protein